MEDPRTVKPAEGEPTTASAARSPASTSKRRNPIPEERLDRIQKRMHNLREQNRVLRKRVQELEQALRDAIEILEALDQKIGDLLLKSEVTRE